MSTSTTNLDKSKIPVAITWHADINSPSGYSRAARQHMRALIEYGATVHAEPKKFDLTDAPLDDFWQRHMGKVLGKAPQRTVVKVWHMTPEMYDGMDPRQYNIGFVVWETDQLPQLVLNDNPRTDWVAQMNRMDEIWTASEFCKRTFMESGVTVPIYVFPHPIDILEFIPGDQTEIMDIRSKLVNTRESLSLFSCFQWNNRKNPNGLMLYYCSRFGVAGDVNLTIKTYGQAFKNNEHITKHIQDFRARTKIPGLKPNVYLMTDLVPDGDLPDMYRSYDAFISLTFGEGFGIPFQEAMACGLPCIYPKGMAMDDFIDETCGYPVETVKDPVFGVDTSGWYHSYQNWLRPLYESFVEQADNLYKDWKSGHLKEKGEAARARIEELHSYHTVGRAMYERIQEILYQRHCSIRDRSST